MGFLKDFFSINDDPDDDLDDDDTLFDEEESEENVRPVVRTNKPAKKSNGNAFGSIFSKISQPKPDSVSDSNKSNNNYSNHKSEYSNYAASDHYSRSTNDIENGSGNNNPQHSHANSKVVDFNNMHETAKINIDDNTILISHPGLYEQSQIITDALKRGAVVTIDLQGIDSLTGQRIIDFVAGGISVNDAKIEEVAKNVFLVAPRGRQLITLQELENHNYSKSKNNSNHKNNSGILIR